MPSDALRDAVASSSTKLGIGARTGASIDVSTGAIPVSPTVQASSLDLAAVLATFTSPVSTDDADDESAATPAGAPGRKGATKSLPASSDAAPATIVPGALPAATPDAVTISNLLGLIPQPPVRADAPDKGGRESAARSMVDLAVDAQTLPGAGDKTVSPLVAGPPAPTHAPEANGKGDDFSATLAPIVKSVTVETQLAPPTTLPPMQQVIQTVQKLAEAPASAAPATPTQAAPLSSSRTMTLVLEPENLGTVTVRMQLRGGSLDLQLDVDNAQTLNLLTKEKDSLSAAMANQDYQVATLTMRASETQSGSQGSDNGSRPHDQPGSGTFGGDDGASGRQAPQDGGPASGSRQNGRSRDRSSDGEAVVARSPGLAPAPGAAGLYI